MAEKSAASAWPALASAISDTPATSSSFTIDLRFRLAVLQLENDTNVTTSNLASLIQMVISTNRLWWTGGAWGSGERSLRLSGFSISSSTSRATNTGAQKASDQTKLRARLHHDDADLCTGGAPAYSRFIPTGGPSPLWQLISAIGTVPPFHALQSSRQQQRIGLWIAST
jgi:hypothetical protein